MGRLKTLNISFFSLLIIVDLSFSKIIQGDILVSTGANTHSDPSISSGVQLANASVLWTDKKIYYRFDDPSFQNFTNKKQVRDMMDYIQAKLDGCITFHEVFNSDSDHVLITSRGCGGEPGNKCYAHVGRKGKQQCLNLDLRTCMFNRTIVHELLHTMGFEHEHVRPDRDQFLTVITENIRDGSEGDFKKRERGISRYFDEGNVDTQNTPFDFMSVLLYPPSRTRQFSKDGKKPTLKYKDPIIPSWPEFPPDEEPLTWIDTVEMALAYNCHLDQKQIIDYVNINRISGVQKMKILERKMQTLETSLIDLSNTNKVFQFAVSPDIVTVSSDKGQASQKQDQKMGVYRRTEDFNDHPMWINHDTTQKIYYSSSGYWSIGPNAESNYRGIKSAKKDLPLLPVTGWQYYDDTWIDDAQLTVSAGQPVYPQSILVSSDGPAGREHHECMGQYNKIEGQQYNGRPVWKHSERDDRILFYSDFWMISNDPKDTSGYISSVKFGLVNIPGTGWKYGYNGEWHQDDKLEFL